MSSEIYSTSASFTCVGFFYSERVLTQFGILDLLGATQGGISGVFFSLFQFFLAVLGNMEKINVGS